MTKRPTTESKALINGAAMGEEPEVLSLVEDSGLSEPGPVDPGLFVPVLFFRVLEIAIPETEFLVALLGKVAFVVVST